MHFCGTSDGTTELYRRIINAAISSDTLFADSSGTWLISSSNHLLNRLQLGAASRPIVFLQAEPFLFILNSNAVSQI